MNERDHTFGELSAYGSATWVACRLGWQSRASLDKKRKTLTEFADFPSPDPINNLYLKADVEAWIEKRRQIRDKHGGSYHTESPKRIRHDNL